MKKDQKVFIFSLTLMIIGIIGGGLFAIANSLNQLTVAIYKINNTSAINNIICGIILFCLLAVGIAGFSLMIHEIQKKNKE